MSLMYGTRIFGVENPPFHPEPEFVEEESIGARTLANNKRGDLLLQLFRVAKQVIKALDYTRTLKNLSWIHYDDHLISRNHIRLPMQNTVDEWREHRSFTPV